MTGAVATALDVKDSDVREMEVRMSGRDFSLDNALAEEGETSHLDRLKSDGPDSEAELIDLEETSNREVGVHRALAKLNERETFIVEKRILAEKPATLQEVGDQLKISRERVRQLETGALKKLKGELWPALSN